MMMSPATPVITFSAVHVLKSGYTSVPFTKAVAHVDDASRPSARVDVMRGSQRHAGRCSARVVAHTLRRTQAARDYVDRWCPLVAARRVATSAALRQRGI